MYCVAKVGCQTMFQGAVIVRALVHLGLQHLARPVCSTPGPGFPRLWALLTGRRWMESPRTPVHKDRSNYTVSASSCSMPRMGTQPKHAYPFDAAHVGQLRRRRGIRRSAVSMTKVSNPKDPGPTPPLAAPLWTVSGLMRYCVKQGSHAPI